MFHQKAAVCTHNGSIAPLCTSSWHVTVQHLGSRTKQTCLQQFPLSSLPCPLGTRKSASRDPSAHTLLDSFKFETEACDVFRNESLGQAFDQRQRQQHLCWTSGLLLITAQGGSVTQQPHYCESAFVPTPELSSWLSFQGVLLSVRHLGLGF